MATGFPIETVAFSVYNVLSHLKRDRTESDVLTLLQQPQIWDPRVTRTEVRRAAAWLAKRGWIRREPSADPLLALPMRHPETQRGLEVVRDPRDPKGKALLQLTVYA